MSLQGLGGELDMGEFGVEVDAFAVEEIQEVGLGGLVAGLVALKLFQEYAIHYARWLDGFTATEAVEAVWRWLTPF